MRKAFQQEMKNLNLLVVEMGAMCESAIANAYKAIFDAEEESAERVADLEKKINRKEREIEHLCYRLLLLQQPVARDLRHISSTLRMITDMERIGDQAENIAVIAREGTFFTQDVDNMGIVKEMSIRSVNMVTNSIDSYIKQDLQMAHDVIEADDAVDDLFYKLKNQLVDMIVTDREKAEFAFDLLMVARYLERIADHAVNIGEWVVFIITGEHPKRIDEDS